jgi:hypothetical protein
VFILAHGVASGDIPEHWRRRRCWTRRSVAFKRERRCRRHRCRRRSGTRCLTSNPARSSIGSSNHVNVECSVRMCSASSADVQPRAGSVGAESSHSETSTATTRRTCAAIASANLPVPAPRSTTVLDAPIPSAWSPATSSLQSVGDSGRSPLRRTRLGAPVRRTRVCQAPRSSLS